MIKKAKSSSGQQDKIKHSESDSFTSKKLFSLPSNGEGMRLQETQLTNVCAVFLALVSRRAVPSQVKLSLGPALQRK